MELLGQNKLKLNLKPLKFDMLKKCFEVSAVFKTFHNLLKL